MAPHQPPASPDVKLTGNCLRPSEALARILKLEAGISIDGCWPSGLLEGAECELPGWASTTLPLPGLICYARTSDRCVEGEWIVESGLDDRPDSGESLIPHPTPPELRLHARRDRHHGKKKRKLQS